MARMFIRRTRTNNTATGEDYFTFRLVRGERIAGKVRQITVLNLGRHFPIAQEDWPLLCSRIEQLLAPQALIAAIECPGAIERAAQRYYAKLVGRADSSETIAASSVAGSDTPELLAGGPADLGAGAGAAALPSDLQSVEIDSLELSQPRSVGVEHVALHAMAQLGLVDKLTRLGLNAVTRACILGNLIGRMAEPASPACHLAVAGLAQCPGGVARCGL